jgi:hypothetical protein
MSQPVWQTPAGSLGTIPEGVFYSLPLSATADATVYYQLIAGALPRGMQINETGIIVGIPNARATIQGVPLDVPVDTVSKFAVRAFTRTGQVVNRLADRTFTIEVANTAVPAFTTPAGQLTQTYDGTLITDLQIEYTGPDNTIVKLIAGSLPPGKCDEIRIEHRKLGLELRTSVKSLFCSWLEEATKNDDIPTSCVLHSYKALLFLTVLPDERTPDDFVSMLSSAAFVRSRHGFAMGMMRAQLSAQEGEVSLTPEQRLLRFLQAQGLDSSQMGQEQLKRGSELMSSGGKRRAIFVHIRGMYGTDSVRSSRILSSPPHPTPSITPPICFRSVSPIWNVSMPVVLKMPKSSSCLQLMYLKVRLWQ